jgi:squalene-hopene/tetraprenyl-beta-curcumene cyclase
MRTQRWPASLSLLVLAVLTSTAPAQAPQAKLKINSANEPMAREFSLERSAAFLDNQSLAWTQGRKCGTCHTNYPYLLARPMLKGDLAAHDEVRKFFEKRIANWDSGKKEDAPRWDTEVVATAATLAIQDSFTGKLHPLTRQALDRMWTLQQKDGAWNWLKCAWPPSEHDDYYGAVYVAVGVGRAPDNYAETDKAKAGLANLRRYLKNNPPPNLHHKAMLLWASLKLDGLMSDKLKQSTIQELLAVQRPDGGWSLPSLGDWVGRDERPNDRFSAPSDGYATGLVVYILRQAGVPADNAQVQKGVAWLKKNQRESGSWFTRSLNTDNYHFITHAGTAYAVMALKACE